jgi:uncharacterized protein YjiS (DUF1127 family)
MPPQQTNIATETEGDTAALGLDLPTALAARPNASIAALDGALSEKDVAGPTDTSTSSVPGLLKRCWHAFWERRQRRGSGAALHDLSDRELMDIGLTRGEVDYLTPQRAIDTLRDSTKYLWDRGGM